MPTLKRFLVHVSGLNLGLLMRRLTGVGTPRSLEGRTRACVDPLTRALFPNGVFRRLAQNRLAALRAPANDSLVSVGPAGRRGGFGGFGLGCLKLPLRLRCANGSA